VAQLAQLVTHLVRLDLRLELRRLLLAERMEHEGGHLLLEVLLLLVELIKLVEMVELLRVLQVRLLQTSVLLAAHEQRAVLGRGVQLHACG